MRPYLHRVYFTCAFILSSVTLLAQELQLHGKVSDKNSGKALPGVTLTKQNTDVKFVTDSAGQFSFRTNTGDVFVISSIGYEPWAVTILNDAFLEIQLAPVTTEMNEVVITALGIKKEKARLGYSVQDVKGENLVKAREPNVVNSLTGRVAGLQVSNSTDMFQDAGLSLRGRKPLIVIDGIPDQSADMWKINADDVENISVLKGASASALYGSIGQNGAIMVTTKRGKGKQLSVDLNSSVLFQTGFIRIPKVQTTYGNGNKGIYAYIDGTGGGTEGGGWIWGPKLDQPDAGTPSGYYETTQFDSPIDPATGNRIPTPWLSRGKNNVKDFFQNGSIVSNNISITKESENGSFRASAGHIYQEGTVPNTSLNNTSFSLAGKYSLTKAFTVDTRFTYNREYTDNFPEVGYGPTNYLYNLVLWTGVDVDVKKLRNYWAPGQEGLQQSHFNNSWYNNPYFQAYEYLRGYQKDNSFGSLDLNYKISPAFSAKFRTGMNGYALNRSYKEPKSYVGYSNISRGNFTSATVNYIDIVSDLMLSYDHAFSGDFKVHAEAGGANYFRNQKYQSANTDGLTIPGFFNLSNSVNAIQGSNGLEERRTSSLYGFVDLEYKNAFYLTVTGRNDKISTLPVENNKYFYPSGSASVVLSNLLNLPSAISFLKTRGSWSRVSSGTLNDNAYTYGFLQAYERGTNGNNTPSLSYGTSQINPNIRPQTSDSWEAGMELKLFGGRFGFDATYYQTRDYNNIVSIPVSETSGFTSRLENGNVYKRKGLEMVLTGTPVKTRDFRWDVAANMSHYRRFLVEIYGDASQLNKIKTGERTDRIFDWVFEKDRAGNVVYESNGFPKWDNFTRYIGNDEPDLVYGLENTLTYKNFTLRSLVDGRIGGLIYSTTNYKMWWGGTHPGTVNQFRDDANEGKDTYIGKGVIVVSGDIQYDSDGNVLSDTRKFAPNTLPVNYIDYMINTGNSIATNNNYYSETFLKLREVSLTWQLPAKWLSNKFIKDATVSAVGRNLLLVSKLKNVDPDPGSDNLQTPSTRNIGVNFNLRF